VPAYEFTIEMEGTALSGEDMRRLFERHCADALFGVTDDAPFADFSREAENYGAAVGSAIQDVEAALPGVRVTRVIRDLRSLSAAG
jgi:hypothetical protein